MRGIARCSPGRPHSARRRRDIDDSNGQKIFQFARLVPRWPASRKCAAHENVDLRTVRRHRRVPAPRHAPARRSCVGPWRKSGDNELIGVAAN
jgi:hypothetical protein